MIQLGFGDASLNRLVRTRGWERVHPGVYRLPGQPQDFRQAVVAAQLALPVPSVATAATAAHLYGLRSQPKSIDLLVGEHDRLKPPNGARLTRTRTLVRQDVTVIDGIRLATTPRMVIDFARTALPPEVRALIIDCRQRRLLSLPDLGARVETMRTVRGKGVVKQLVWELDESRCDSVLELMARRLLAAARLPAPEPAPVAVRTSHRVLHVDIGWPDHRVGLEVDGHAFHSSRSDLERDHRRANALALAGWTVLRVGWGRLETDGNGLVEELRQLLALNRPDHFRMRK